MGESRPPEGTPAQKPGRNSGFYRIAEQAGTPFCPGFPDYEHNRPGIGPRFNPSGEQQAGLVRLREFCGGMKGRWSENTGPVEFVQ